jgi:hypothetical protein
MLIYKMWDSVDFCFFKHKLSKYVFQITYDPFLGKGTSLPNSSLLLSKLIFSLSPTTIKTIERQGTTIAQRLKETKMKDTKQKDSFFHEQNNKTIIKMC